MVSHNNQILIGGHIFIASLIALGSSNKDVILGMDWLVANQAVIDCATKSVQLSYPSSQIVYFSSHTEPVPLYALKAHPLPMLEAVPVVCDFPDVLPKELPGKPPDRAI